MRLLFEETTYQRVSMVTYHIFLIVGGTGFFN
jgi:hypothetical protein